jgi:phospholipid/cholesterol/gamma-HCH transport system substrate-binding protein
MENRSHALWAGFFTLAMLCATIFAGIWLNRDKTLRTDYLIVTSKPISGLNPQASVRYKGLAVGRVDKIEFDPHVAGQIDIKISIDPETPITKSTFATLGYQGVTGIAFVQLDDDGSDPVRLTGGSKETRPIPLRPGLLEKLERNGTTIFANAELVTERLAQFFTPDNQQTMLNAFANTSQATARWTKVADGLKPTVQRMPQLADQANQTMLSIQELAKNAAQLSQQIGNLTTQLQDPNGPFNQTLNSYGSLGTSVQSDTLPKINELTNDVSQTMRTFNKTLEEINQNPQDLIFGKSAAAPGPGEPGFVSPVSPK